MSNPLQEVLTGHLTEHGPLPKLRLPGDDQLLSPFIEEAAKIIAESHEKHPDRKPHLYRRDCVPVFPLIPGLKKIGRKLVRHTHRLSEMKPEYFMSWVDRHFAPFKTRYDRAGDPFDVLRPMPKEVARACLESPDFTMNLPPIERTFPIPMPTIGESGKLSLCTAGYHEETATMVFSPPWEPDPDFIVKDDGMVSSFGIYDDRVTLREACMGLHQLYSRFPMSDWSEPFVPGEDHPCHDPEDPKATIRQSRSFAVQIMGMLAMFAGGCVPQQASRLGFLANANKQRSGKTLLIKMMVSPIYGKFKAQSWREEEENMLKILDSETLAASTYVCFDNVRGLIASQPLEGFMTTPVWTGRILGRSEMFEAENNALIFLTANNASLGPDMQERLLFIDLYVETADRQDREDELPAEAEIDDVWLADLGNRRRILSWLWAIVRHWDAAGRPAASGKPRRGFGAWCRTIAGMVEFAGFGDPLERPSNLENCGDSESADIRQLIATMSADLRARQATFQEIVHACWEGGLFPWLMHGREEYTEDLQKPSLILNDSCRSKFGLLLQRNCSGERGEVHVFKTPQGERRVRFYCKGRGRSRRYHFDELQPHQ